MKNSTILSCPAALLLACCVTRLSLPAQTTRSFTLRPAPGKAVIAPGRTVTNGWLYNKKLPGPLIRVREGDRVRVKVFNDLAEPTTVHWHGLPVDLKADGVPGVSQGLIGVGQEYDYEFLAKRPGTYWYHPHIDLQIDRGLVGALIVDPKNSKADPPYDREYLLLVDDWLPGAPVAGRDPVYTDYLINGKTSAGQTPMLVKKGETVRLRILNVSGATAYAFTVDGHTMRVTHADGQPLFPVTTKAIPIGPGERYDVYVTANNPGKWSIAFANLLDRSRTLVRAVLAYASATGNVPPPNYVPVALRTAPLLTYAQLKNKGTGGGLFARPTRTYDLSFTMGGMFRYVWMINGQAFPNASPIPVSYMDKVRFRAFNRTMMYHPMHLHGHFMRVHGSAGGTTAPLVKDTVLVPPGSMIFPGRLDVDFLADNPGNWAYHCHQIYHMGAGMMRLVEYVGRDGDGDGLADGKDFSPASAYPVTWTEGLGGKFAVGSRVRLVAQWKPGEQVFWFVGLPLAQGLSLGSLGVLGIRPPLLYLGRTGTTARNVATIDLPIPGDPSLKGGRLGIQALATQASLKPGLRLSTRSYLTLR